MPLSFYEKNFIDVDNSINQFSLISFFSNNTSRTFSGDTLNNLRNRKNNNFIQFTQNNLTRVVLDVEFSRIVNFDTLIIPLVNLTSVNVRAYNGNNLVASNNSNFRKSLYYTFANSLRVNRIEVEFPNINSNFDASILDNMFSSPTLFQLILTKKIGSIDNREPLYEVDFMDRGNVKKTQDNKHKIAFYERGLNLKAKYTSLIEESIINLLTNLYRRQTSFLVSLEQDYTFRSEKRSLDVFRKNNIEPYRPQDLYLMNLRNTWSPNYYQGRYDNGIPFNLDFVEVQR